MAKAIQIGQDYYRVTDSQFTAISQAEFQKTPEKKSFANLQALQIADPTLAARAKQVLVAPPPTARVEPQAPLETRILDQVKKLHSKDAEGSTLFNFLHAILEFGSALPIFNIFFAPFQIFVGAAEIAAGGVIYAKTNDRAMALATAKNGAMQCLLGALAAVPIVGTVANGIAAAKDVEDLKILS